MKASIFALASVVALAGCGGGGSTGNANASLTVSPSPALYASPVTVSWNSTNALEIEESNLGIGESDTHGTLTDNPGIDSTYRFTVRVQNENNVSFTITKSASVAVVKSLKSVLIIGNTSVSGPNQVRDSLQTITTGSVGVQASIPASVSQSVVVLHPSATLTTADKAKVESFLSAGKAVVFIGNAVINVSGGNVSSMGGILAGATSYHTTSAQYATFRSVDGFVPLSLVNRGVRLTATGADGLTDIANSADRILTTSSGTVTSAFAYRVPSGGRTAFVTEDGVGSTAHAQGYDVALRAIVRWCMDGS